MKTTASQDEAQHPPLARDANGYPIAVPDGTSTWRICRQTTGRPREIVGHDKQPIRFPIETTCDELISMCGRDVYRVYALDEVGKQLDYVTTLDLTSDTRDLRNATSHEWLVPALRSTTGISVAPTSDLRFALEAMTQMMRTNSDALRTVAESQVDLAKALVTANGLRNAAWLVPPAAHDTTGDGDEEELDDREPVEKSWVDLAMPFAQKLAEVVPGLVAGKAMQDTASRRELSATSEGEQLSQKPQWELRDFVDWGYAAKKKNAKEDAAAKRGAPATVIPAALEARVLGDPELVQRLLAIKSELSSDDVALLMAALEASPEAQQLAFLAQIKGLSLERAAALCREAASALHDVANTNPGKAG